VVRFTTPTAIAAEESGKWKKKMRFLLSLPLRNLLRGRSERRMRVLPVLVLLVALTVSLPQVKGNGWSCFYCTIVTNTLFEFALTHGNDMGAALEEVRNDGATITPRVTFDGATITPRVVRIGLLSVSARVSADV
jgi:hypothetical protein